MKIVNNPYEDDLSPECSWISELDEESIFDPDIIASISDHIYNNCQDKNNFYIDNLDILEGNIYFYNWAEGNFKTIIENSYSKSDLSKLIEEVNKIRDIIGIPIDDIHVICTQDELSDPLFGEKLVTIWINYINENRNR